ncbi:retrovirus-related pol polyprotein from transposon TNT 1-94, partial [Tanacetum coccineum]
MLRHVSLEERPIVVLGFRGGLLGANPIPHRLARGMQFGTGRAVWHDHVVWHEPEQFISELNNISLPCLYSLFVRALRAGAIYRTESEDIQRIYELFVKYMGHIHGQRYDKGQEAIQKQVKIMEDRRDKLAASRVKEVNQAARDSDDALVCCVENTVEDHILDSGASFHATYCKEELERFKLRSSKVRLTDDKTLDIASVRDVILKTYFGTSWTLKDVRYIPSLKRRLISVGQLDEEGYHVGFEGQQWKVTKGSLLVAHGNKLGSLYMVEISTSVSQVVWEAEESFFHNVSEDKETTENGIVMLKMVLETPLQFGVAERLSLTFRAESTGIRVEAPKMLWADSVSTTYLIYCIPYVLIGLRIPEEEWRGKDTSLAHLKVFGCDSFVKVKDVYGEAMKCLAELVLWASLEFHSRGPEFDSCLIPIVIIHISIHVDATWAHMADMWIHVAYHVATRPTVDTTVAWRSTIVDRWSGSGPTVVHGGLPPLTVVGHRRH